MAGPNNLTMEVSMWEQNGKKSISGNVGFVKMLISVIVVALLAWSIIATHPANVRVVLPNWNYPQSIGR